WGEAAYGLVIGADQFDDLVSALKVEALRSSPGRLNWLLRVKAAQRTVDRTVIPNGFRAKDVAEMRFISVSAGPRLSLGEFGRVTLYSSAAIGYAHDRITHDYTFISPSDPATPSLFAPQSPERSASGVVGEVS